MQYDLVVVIAFGSYRVGDRIADPATVAAIEASVSVHFVVQVLRVGSTPTLATLTLSTLAATAGTPFSATAAGLTPGSTLAASSNDGTALTVANGTISGTFASAGTPTITLTETLAGAAGSPKTTTLTVTVAAVAPPPANDNALSTALDLASSFAL